MAPVESNAYVPKVWDHRSVASALVSQKKAIGSGWFGSRPMSFGSTATVSRIPPGVRPFLNCHWPMWAVAR